MRIGSQPVAVGLAREPVARQRRDHQMERVGRARAVGGGVGQRLDDLQLLDDRAGPAVGDDHRQRILMLRPHVNEVDVQPVDLGDELRQGVQPRLHLPASRAPSPMRGERLHRPPVARLATDSPTLSRSGQRVSRTRCRRSTRSASGTVDPERTDGGVVVTLVRAGSGVGDGHCCSPQNSWRPMPHPESPAERTRSRP